MTYKEQTCPRCKQGTVVKAEVRKKARTVFLCDECEAVWFCENAIEYATFNYFSCYMERLGLPAIWSELDVLDSK